MKREFKLSNYAKFLPKCVYCIYDFYLLNIVNRMYVNFLVLDESEGELIRPCLCTGDREYIHVRCLEIIANIRKHSLFCAVCDVPYPLKLKYKPLIEVSHMKGLTIAKCSSKIKSNLERRKKDFYTKMDYYFTNLKNVSRKNGYTL